MLSPRQYSQTVGKPYSTIMTWLQRGLLAGAIQIETPNGYYWAIPIGTQPPGLRRGPKEEVIQIKDKKTAKLLQGVPQEELKALLFYLENQENRTMSLAMEKAFRRLMARFNKESRNKFWEYIRYDTKIEAEHFERVKI